MSSKSGLNRSCRARFLLAGTAAPSRLLTTQPKLPVARLLALRADPVSRLSALRLPRHRIPAFDLRIEQAAFGFPGGVAIVGAAAIYDALGRPGNARCHVRKCLRRGCGATLMGGPGGAMIEFPVRRRSNRSLEFLFRSDRSHVSASPIHRAARTRLKSIAANALSALCECVPRALMEFCACRPISASVNSS